MSPVDRLRLVVFTSGPLSPVNRVFFERLAADPLVNVVGIVVDEYRPRRRPALVRAWRALRREGWPWLAFKLRTKAGALVRRLALTAFEWAHPPGPDESYEDL